MEKIRHLIMTVRFSTDCPLYNRLQKCLPKLKKPIKNNSPPSTILLQSMLILLRACDGLMHHSLPKNIDCGGMGVSVPFWQRYFVTDYRPTYFAFMVQTPSNM